MNKNSQISIPLDLPDVNVVKTEVNRRGEYIITVESTRQEAQGQPGGRTIEQWHGYGHWITVRHLPILGHTYSPETLPVSVL